MPLEPPALEGTLGADLETLLERLRDAGVPIGPREYVAANRLVARLLSEPEFIEPSLSLHSFRAQLAPLLVKSSTARETFDRAFDAIAPGPRPPPVLDERPRREAEGGDPTPPRYSLGRFWWIAPLLVTMLVGAAALRFITLPPKPPPAPLGPVPTSSRLAPTPTPAPTTEVNPFARLDAASVPFAGAPTLDELASELSRTAPIQVDPAAYAQALHAMTGLPRRQPLPIGIVRADLPAALTSGADPRPFAELLRDPTLDARLAQAIATIEQPGRLPPALASLEAQAAALTPSGDAVALAKSQGTVVWSSTTINSNGRRSVGPAPLLAIQIADAGGKASGKPDPDTLQRAEALISDVESPAAPWRRGDSLPAPERGLWMPLLAAAAPLAWLVAWLLRTFERRKAFLRRRPPSSPPLRTSLALTASQPPRNDLAHRAMLRSLQRRTPKPSERVDIEGTVRATLERGGGRMVQPCFEETRASPEYLVLIERQGPRDQDAQRMYELAKGLRELFAVDVFFYQSDPSYVETEDGAQFRAIEQLIASHPNHRLLVLGSGAGFLDPYSLVPVDGALRLTYWPQRALLTPLPVAEWAREEFALAGGLGMPIGRATSEGMMALAGMMGLDTNFNAHLLDGAGDGGARPLVERLRHEPFRYLNSRPPDDEPLEELIRALRRYLGPSGFEWLCALAIYPAVQWELTLFLGLQLTGAGGGTLYTEQRLAALTQLPWLRSGVMPDWLRRPLIALLGEGQAAAARACLLRLLEAARESGAAPERLELARELALSSPPPDKLFEDEVFVDFLAHGRLEDFAAPSPGALERLVPPTFRRGIDPEEATIAGGAAIYAAASFWLAPSLAGGWSYAGAWTPLLLVYLGALLAILMAWPRQTLVLLQRAAVREAPLTLIGAAIAFAVLIPGLTPLLGWATGGPGQFVLASALAGLLLVPPAVWLASLAGAPTIRNGNGWRAFAGLGLEGAGIAAVALIVTKIGAGEQAPEAWIGAVGAVALSLFAAGWASGRWPVTLPRAVAGSPERDRTIALARIGLVLITLTPALLATAWIWGNDRILQTATASGEPALIVRSADGALIAFATSDRLVSVRSATPPYAVSAQFTASAPVTAISLIHAADGAFAVLVGTYDGAFALSRGGNVVTSAPGARALSPVTALVPTRGDESVFGVLLADGRAGVLRVGTNGLTLQLPTAAVPPPPPPVRAAIAAAQAPLPPPPPLAGNNAFNGSWRGSYSYNPSPTAAAQASNDFTLTLQVSGSQVTGDVTEPNTFGTAGVAFLHATIIGQINGDTITFRKTYDGTGGQTHFVDYTGTIDRLTNTISGTWIIPPASAAIQAAQSAGPPQSAAPPPSPTTGGFKMTLSP